MLDKHIKIPAITLKSVTVLPGMTIHFDINRPRLIRAAETAMMQNEDIFLVTQINPQKDNPTIDDVYKVGTLASVKQLIKLPNRMVRVMVEVKERAEIIDFISREPYLVAELFLLEAVQNDLEPVVEEAMLRIIKQLTDSFAMENPNINKEGFLKIREAVNLDDALKLAAINIPMGYEKKQEFLEAVDITQQYEMMVSFINDEIEVNRVKSELQQKVKERIDKNQREYILREQLKVIREELGEDNTVSDSDTFLQETDNLIASDKVKEKIRKEISRFKTLASNSSESSVVRGYIETLLEMPWDKSTEDNTDINHAEQVLDADHYGLEKVKERMLEFLAVRNFTGSKTSTIICLVGPPGTGKTSIARSVAQALGKKYVRICLGGVRDEAEIRGHRRTYVGAMPGRIANGMKQAGVKNPLMLLDEIDKLGSDYKGDPSSALLEVLDSEQNSRFRDHYIEIPIDLSEVLFIATANTTQTIPRPLLDRMEIIEVTSYTANEKEHIAKEHLYRKQLSKHGLKQNQLYVSDEALRMIIQNYTKEAGVRNLERRIGELCRKAARELVVTENSNVTIGTDNIEKYLGKKLYTVEPASNEAQVGIARGLAWTSVGGETLQIEVNVMRGKGEIILTGKLGDVMKESAKAGLSYIRSVADKYNIPREYFEEHDIHIHIPEGAVPKDGPSAGITMATAMLSAIINIPVFVDVAMTGEITLRGRVLPIGGLKEKILAAKTVGIKKVLVPRRNEPDVEEISDEIKEGMEIIFVEKMEEVLKNALGEIDEN